MALVCALIEAAGLAIIWLAPARSWPRSGPGSPVSATRWFIPASALEAIRRAPPQSRGLAMGAFTACLDLALGLAGPALGLLAGVLGLGAVFLASALVVLGAAAISLRLLQAPAAHDTVRRRSPEQAVQLGHVTDRQHQA